MIYLASPYSHPDEQVRKDRFMAVASFVGDALRQGYLIFSPVVYGHALVQIVDLPTDALAWEAFNSQMLSNCREMWVLKLSGWEQSLGVQAEIADARNHHLSVSYWSARGEPERTRAIMPSFNVLSTPNTANG